MATTEGDTGQSGGTRVLVVDPEQAICDLIASVLADIDGTVKCAASIREAQELASRETFDMALVEVMLPDGPGEELAAFLSRRGIRTTLMSGHPTGIGIGASTPHKFLAKPFSVSDLLRVFVYQRVAERSGDRS